MAEQNPGQNRFEAIPTQDRSVGQGGLLSGFSMGQIALLASFVSMDFAFGFVMKAALHATGITQFIRVEMIVPTMLLMLAAQSLNRFGTMTLYQVAWATLATVALPGAIVPGPLKLVPAFCQGLACDLIFYALRGRGRAQIYLTAIVGGLISSMIFMAIRIMLGLPWAPATQFLFAFRLMTSVLVDAFGAYLAILIWQRVRQTPLAHFIGVGR